MKDVNDMTRRDFEKLRHRGWEENIGAFDSIVILPCRVPSWSRLLYAMQLWLSRRLRWIARPELYSIRGMHDSGYRCMDFVAIREGEPVCRLAGSSDVVHLDGIGGYGHDWLNKGPGIPKVLPIRDWNFDCLDRSGLLHLWCRGKLHAAPALSSFELYCIDKERA